MHKIQSTLSVNITLTLTEGEARALEAITGYGPDLFIKWFYKTHGRYYLENHAIHVESLFQKARSLNYDLREIDEFRKKVETIKIEKEVPLPGPPIRPPFWVRFRVKMKKLVNGKPPEMLSVEEIKKNTYYNGR